MFRRYLLPIIKKLFTIQNLFFMNNVLKHLEINFIIKENDKQTENNHKNYTIILKHNALHNIAYYSS